MQLDTVTSEQFDVVVAQLSADQPDAEAYSEIRASRELAGDSRICGVVCREAHRRLGDALVNSAGDIRFLFAAVFATAYRLGWHAHRMLTAQDELDKLMPQEEIARVRTEIRKEH